MEEIKAVNKTKTKNSVYVKKLVMIALFGALATVVMMWKFPIPLAPSFYKFEFSEVITLLGAYILGPVSGVVIELIKCLLNLLIDGTTTAYVGEISNFVIGCSLIVPASILMRKMKGIKGLVLGGVVGIISVTVVAALLNYFVLIPAYVSVAGYPMDAIIGMAASIYPSIDDLFGLIILCTVPFNLLKGCVSVLAGVLIAKALPKKLTQGI